MPETLSNSKKPPMLFYACGGASNTAEAALLCARALVERNHGEMGCLTGLSCGRSEAVSAAKTASNIVLDGCPTGCAKRIFDSLGLANVTFLRVTELGVPKGPRGTRAKPREVEFLISQVMQSLRIGA